MRENKNLCANYFAKFSIDFDRMCSTVETFVWDEPHTHFMSSIQYSKERTMHM